MDYAPIEGVTVIGLGHKARQGKDTVAGFIQDRLGSKAERMPFAEDLYAVARVMFGMTTKDPALLQVLGTDVFRRKSPDVWVQSVYYKLMDRRPKVALITDVRFPNEADFVKQLGGKLVKVVRSTDSGQYLDPNRSATHPSETALDSYDGWDYVLVSQSGSPEALRPMAEALLEETGLI